MALRIHHRRPYRQVHRDPADHGHTQAGPAADPELGGSHAALGRGSHLPGVPVGPHPFEPAWRQPHVAWLADGLIVVLPPLAALVAALGSPLDSSMWPLFAVAGSQSLCLIWSRRFPLAVLFAVTGLEVILVALDQEILVATLAAASGLGAWGSRVHQRLGLVFGVLLLAAGLASSVTNVGFSGYTVAGLAALGALFVGFWLLGRDMARRRLRLRLLESERVHAERRAAERERALLARELHDILNHALTGMVLHADATAETGDAADARAALGRIATTGRQSLAELRRLLDVLRTEKSSVDYDPLVVPGGLDHLDDLVRTVPQPGPRVRIERRGKARPADASIEHAAYRVIQESLTNVARHAGPVDVTVRLTYTPTSLDVEVRNAPPDQQPVTAHLRLGGLGLIGMRERVELVGGTLTAGPQGDGGFGIWAQFPLREQG